MIVAERFHEQTIAADYAEWHLLNWARRCGGERYGEGYPSRSPAFLGLGGSQTTDDWNEAEEQRAAEAVDAIVWYDLTNIERCAVQSAYTATVWRFPRGGFDEALARAKEKVGRRMHALDFR